MITFTKEQLIERLQHRISVASGFPESEKAQMDLELARIALASLEADDSSEPVAFINGAWALVYYRPPKELGLKIGDKLYTAPPAPVALPSGYSDFEEIWSSSTHPLTQDDEMKDFAWDIWNACRAAMRQGVDRPQNEPQNIPENIPATQFKPVADLYGLTSPTGGETSFTFDAVEARDFIDGGWSCQEYVELGRYQEALTDHSEGDLDMVRPVMFIDGNLLPGDAEKLKAAIEELNHSGEPTIMIAGDSPVIPDGWVMVPEEPTHEMLEAGDEQFGTYDVYRRMIAASPQQEVK